MIVIDTSAIIAAYSKEADADRIWQVFESAEELRLPVSCYVECVMVLRSQNGARRWLDSFVADHAVSMFGFDAMQARLVADAFERFGRGSGHPARLNFGDCLTYAAAASLGALLLFKGEDFAQTDVRSPLDR